MSYTEIKKMATEKPVEPYYRSLEMQGIKLTRCKGCGWATSSRGPIQVMLGMTEDIELKPRCHKSAEAGFCNECFTFPKECDTRNCSASKGGICEYAD